jgi:hypothetical protein
MLSETVRIPIDGPLFVALMGNTHKKEHRLFISFQVMSDPVPANTGKVCCQSCIYGQSPLIRGAQ